MTKPIKRLTPPRFELSPMTETELALVTGPLKSVPGVVEALHIWEAEMRFNNWGFHPIDPDDDQYRVFAYYGRVGLSDEPHMVSFAITSTVLSTVRIHAAWTLQTARRKGIYNRLWLELCKHYRDRKFQTVRSGYAVGNTVSASMQKARGSKILKDENNRFGRGFVATTFALQSYNEIRHSA